MPSTAFEFVATSNWCVEATSVAEFMAKERSYLSLFKSAPTQLQEPDLGPDSKSPEAKLFYDVPSTGGFTVNQLVHESTPITGSLIAHLGQTTIKDDSLLVLVEPHLALLEAYGDNRWLQFQLNSWPDAHHFPKANTPSNWFSFGSKPKQRVKMYTLSDDLLEISKPCIYLSVRSSENNLYHWLFEVLPRLKCLDIIPQLRDLPLLLRDSLNAYQLHTLKLMGVNNPLLFTEGRSVQIPTLFFPSIPSPPSIHAETVHWLREKLMGKLPQISNPQRRLLISRIDANTRRLTNEAEIMRALGPLGFEHIIMSKLSPSEQIDTIRHAKTIVLTHGAAGANLLFAAPNCAVIELHSPRWPNSVYFTISKILGLPYAYLFGEHQNKQLDYSVDPKTLIQFIQSIEAIS